MRQIAFGLLLLSLFSVSASDSWYKILKERKGTVSFYWAPNNVNISNSRDIIDGVERDLAFAFIDYVNKKYSLNIEVKWIEADNFDEVLRTIEQGTSGIFGTSSISITPERSERFEFTPPYLSDIAVLISGSDVPIANTPGEFNEIFNKRTAVTIKNTTLSAAIEKLQTDLSISFNIQFVENSGQIIDQIVSLDSAFAYIDLPNFLTEFKNSSKIRRQLFYPVKLKGLAMIYPKNSDW